MCGNLRVGFRIRCVITGAWLARIIFLLTQLSFSHAQPPQLTSLRMLVSRGILTTPLPSPIGPLKPLRIFFYATDRSLIALSITPNSGKPLEANELLLYMYFVIMGGVPRNEHPTLFLLIMISTEYVVPEMSHFYSSCLIVYVFVPLTSSFSICYVYIFIHFLAEYINCQRGLFFFPSVS